LTGGAGGRAIGGDARSRAPELYWPARRYAGRRVRLRTGSAGNVEECMAGKYLLEIN
jgi:hypothetical protein